MAAPDRPLRRADWQAVACDLCGANAPEELGQREVIVRGRTSDFDMRFEDVACSRCGFVQALKRPENAFLMDYYRDAHIGHRGGELHFDGKARLAAVAARVPEGGRIIEIGANDGAFCAELAKAGYDAFGFDPVEADEAAGVEKGFLEAGVASVAPRSADAVIAYYVLEHVIDAGAWLRSALALLKDGGALILEVPNYATHPQDSLNPEHLLHFTPETLRELLEQHGLTIETGEISPTVAYGQAIAARLTDRTLAEHPRPASAAFLAEAPSRLAEARTAYAAAKADRDQRQAAAQSACRLAQEADPSGTASVFIWGANEYAERAAPLLSQAFSSVQVVDKSASKIGTPFPGLAAPIAHPDVAADATARIFLLCSPNWNAQIAAEIAASGWGALAVIDAVTGERL
ncbi:class I SAM-dependent methyltransferase [Hyphobacterium sp.]|uniref:class I SAM-dependent methyltransferase n=1 Tax=Hyphobacterium sp. TaxID=2004662 RepID=UPI00374837E4